MQKLTIVAHITAESGKEDRVKSELEKLIPPTVAEAGCIQYDLHQDNDTPTHFMFYENWESRDLWQAHMNAPHLDAFRAATEGALAEIKIYEMTPVG